MTIGLIWAQARDSAGRPVIGVGGGLPWHLPEDLAHFKAITAGHPVVMGRRTWDSLPARFRPLPGRVNIVVTRQPGWRPDGGVGEPGARPQARGAAEEPGARPWLGGAAEGDSPDGVLVADSVPAALTRAMAVASAGQVWVIGGAQIYAAALADARRCEVTDVDVVVDGDAYAPELGPQWRVCAVGDWLTAASGTKYRFRGLERVDG